MVLPKPSFWGLDNGFKFQGARAFSETGSIQIPYEGIDFDPKGGFRPIVFPFGIIQEEKQTPVFSATFMIIAGIFLRIFGQSGPHFFSLLGGWACLLAAWYLWIRHRTNHDGRVYLLLLGFGSPLLFYSLTLWEHAWALALVTLSFALLSRSHSKSAQFREWEPLIAGLLIALAAALRTESLFWALVALILWRYSTRPWRAMSKYLIGLFIGLVIVALINLWQTDTVLPLHISTNIANNRMRSIHHLFVTRAQNLYISLFEGFQSNVWSMVGLLPLFTIALWRTWRHEKNIWIVLFFGAFVACIAYFVVAVNVENPIAYTEVSGGLFWLVPFTALSVLFFRGERRRFWRLMWAGSFLYIIIIASLTPTMRGIHWGPRFIMQVLPFMLIIAVTRSQRWWRHYKVARPIIVMLLVVSVFNQLYSLDLLLGQKRNNAAFNRWIASTGSEPILNPYYWLAGDGALHSDKKPWYFTDRYDRVGFVIDKLRRKGAKRANFLEKPPYIKDEDWWKLGVEPLGEDYFITGSTRETQLRRKWLKIIPSSRAP